MKIIHKAIALLYPFAVLLTSCKHFTSAPTASTIATSTARAVLAETQTAIPLTTLAISPIPRDASPTPYRQPTLIPTIETAKIPDLLNNLLSIETLSAFNGYGMQRITGWTNGFNGGLWHKGSRSRQGYLWMDNNHLLLFPVTGETQQPNWETIYAHPVVMNITTGEIWLPPNDRPMKDSRWFNIILPRWSPRLQALVTAENNGNEEGASTFTADGKRIAHYEGQLIDVSPSGEKIFIAGDTWIDLESGKKVDFGWGPEFGYEVQRWFPIWSRNEDQIYFCCFYYGNAQTAQSYTITDENTIFNGGAFNNLHSLRHADGVWLNDHTVMARYDGWWYEGPDFSVIFDISERTYHNFGILADLPDTFNNNTYSHKSISPNGDYMYISPGAQLVTDPQIYLVDLKTLTSKLYHVDGLDWSANGKYALMGSQVLTLSDQTLHPLPPRPDHHSSFDLIADTWHPTEGVLISIYADKQKHMIVSLLDIEKLTYRAHEFMLPPNFTGSSYTNAMSITWSPKGDRFALEAIDGSFWQVDYPKLEDLKQLTVPMGNVKDVSWSPDGQYLSFTSETDIYIVNVGSNP